MKKKIIISLIIALLITTFSVGLFSCDISIGGGKNGNLNNFIRVFNRVLESAEIKKGGSGSNNSSVSASTDKNIVYASEESRLQTFFEKTNGKMTELVDGKVTENNCKKACAEALKGMVNFGSMVSACVEVVPDFAFEKTYYVPDGVALCFNIKEVSKNSYEIKILVNNNQNEFDCAFYMFISCENDEPCAEYVSASSDSVDFGIYEQSKGCANGYYSVEETTKNPISLDGEKRLKSFVVLDLSENQLKSFSGENTENGKVVNDALIDMGFSTQIEDATKLTAQKEIDMETVIELNEKMKLYSYSSDYVDLDTSSPFEISVLDEYVIPDDVTVVKTRSVPACVKLIIPKHVEKIEVSPFMNPEYLEEIVFTNPEDGNLTEIGSPEKDSEKLFILSYTNVKRFVLPKTVKKMEVRYFRLCCNMELLDLSALTLKDNSPTPCLNEQNADDFYKNLKNLLMKIAKKEQGSIYDEKKIDEEARAITDSLMGKTDVEIGKYLSSNYGAEEHEMEKLLYALRKQTYLTGEEDTSFIMFIETSAEYRLIGEQGIDKFITPQGVFSLKTEYASSIYNYIDERLGIDDEYFYEVDFDQPAYLVKTLDVRCEKLKEIVLLELEHSIDPNRKYWLYNEINTTNKSISDGLNKEINNTKKVVSDILGEIKVNLIVD